MKTENITGRDGIIISKALAYAIATIQALPPEKQEWSDMHDMIAILNAWHPNEFIREGVLAQTVEIHTGRRPVLIDEKAPNAAA